MPLAPDHPTHEVSVRPATLADLDALVTLEHEAFRTDRMSRRSFRGFLTSPNAAMIVADLNGKLAGYALVLFRTGSALARLYSIAASPHAGRRGIGATLLQAAEAAAIKRGAATMRLEVHEKNAAAISRYRKSGYREFGRHHEYYGDKGHALRFEKRLVPDLARLKDAPPYFHQVHVRAGLHDDGAGLGRSVIPADAGVRIQAVA